MNSNRSWNARLDPSHRIDQNRSRGDDTESDEWIIRRSRSRIASRSFNFGGEILGGGGRRGKSEWQLTREVNPDCPVGPCHSPFNSGGPNPEEKFEEFDESSVEHTDRTFRWRDYDLSHEFLSLIRLSHLSHG